MTTASLQAVRTATAFTFFADGARMLGRWLAEQAMDERDQHLAGAIDHDDFVRRQRDCAAFEHRCAMLPRLH
ncbi:MAG: hypothetical protein MUF03_00725 [Rubrivivax sp.]|jgi:hypothetical protein|nr:hypothetical protein [Rubrivivax sp.]